LMTPQILDLLKRFSVKASFFFTGQNVSTYQDIAIRAFQEGHSILSHSYSHPDLTKETPENVKRELLMTEDMFSTVIGRRPAVVRPPYGAINEEVLSVLKELKSIAALWSIDSLDWAPNISVDNIVRNVLNNVRPGDIVLMHSYSSLNVVLEALPSIILGLKSKGYKLVDIGELLNMQVYK